MSAAGIALWLVAAANPPVPSAPPATVPPPRASGLHLVPRSPWSCRTHDKAESRDLRLRRAQIAFGVIWALGSAAVIGGAVGVGVTTGHCIRGDGCKPTIASAAILGIGIPLATTGLIGFAISTGIRRSDNRTAKLSLAPTGLRLRF